mgnify:CR=1 FL=1
MPIEIRALIFIFLIVAIPMFIFMRFADHFSLKNETKKWVLIWVVTTALAFLSHNFWLFLAFMSLILLTYTKNNPTLKVSLFFVLLPSIPSGHAIIPGFGIVNYFISINFQMFLSAILMLPLAISKSNSNRAIKSSEFLIYCFFLLSAVTHFQESSFIRQGVLITRESSITEVLRYSVILTLQMLVPYLAISRTIRTSQQLQTVLFAMLFGIFLQASIAIAETLKYWRLYNSVGDTLGLISGSANYLQRENLLRASGAFEHPITLGAITTIGIGLLLHFSVRKKPRIKRYFWIIMAIIGAGLIATLSRGPWVGAAALVLTYLLLSNQSIKKISKLAVIGVFSLLVASMTPMGDRIVGLIPYINSDEASHSVSTITYRERLFEQSLKVIVQNPIFGSVNYLRTPEMEEMRQGEGIIDMVNEYLAIALEYGLFGLSIYLGIFMFIMIKIYKAISYLKRNNKEETLLSQGKVIFVIMCGFLVTAATTGISVMAQYFLWSLTGLAVAYINVFQSELLNMYRERNEVATSQPPIKSIP